MSDKNDSKLPNIPGGEGPKDPRVNTITAILLLAVLGYLVFGMGSNPFAASGADTLATSDFVAAVKDDRVKDVTFKYADGSLTGTYWASGSDKGSSSALKSFKSVYVGADSLAELMSEHPGTTYRIDTSSDEVLQTLLFSVLPTVIMLLVFIYFMRRVGNQNGQAMSFGKTKALTAEGERPKVKFSDVAGIDEAVEELQEVRDFLSEPERYRKMGAKIPHGVLLVGPPGTGKTLLAKAVAGEAGVPFFSISGSDFVEMFVGVGASRVRDLFKQAKEAAPCIIFIDEIDAVGRARSKNPSMGGNDERENTLNALLTEMDGFGTNSGVIVLAATNRVDMLDKALLRAGRFDRQIHVDLPDLAERKAIFQVHLKPLKTDHTLDIDYLARQTPGFSGADIANVCNEAALIAARHNKSTVSKQDFLDAVDRIIGGLEKKTKVMTAEEKRSIAIHEAGHATISWFCRHANPLIKVTIVPRGQALGAAWYLPEERVITTKEEMLDEMCALLGGRAAEDLFVGQISTGAMNDLERATKSAYGMVAYAGMSEKLPNICYYNNQDYQFQRPYSETTAKIMDDEVLKMINEEYARAKDILTQHKEGHHQLAELLFSKEVIYADDVEKIFGKRPWASRSEEIIQENERLAKEKEKEDEPKLEDMPDIVKQAQAEHDAAQAEQKRLTNEQGSNDETQDTNKA